ncbi:MAG TPA: hypothetical protein VEX68_22105 [Bryobacteraceae bacterium]|nr:hypothetical protein [Bryobacteraceae bacterium]
MNGFIPRLIAGEGDHSQEFADKLLSESNHLSVDTFGDKFQRETVDRRGGEVLSLNRALFSPRNEGSTGARARVVTGSGIAFCRHSGNRT